MKIRPRFGLLIIALIATAIVSGDRSPSPQAMASSAAFVASIERDPFHRASCEWTGKIASCNLLEFSTREQAIDAGHRPCKVCRP